MKVLFDSCFNFILVVNLPCITLDSSFTLGARPWKEFNNH